MQNLNGNPVLQALKVGQRAFIAFEQGLSYGQWNAFLDMLTDDFCFFFPSGKYQGAHQGKEITAEFFSYVRTTFPAGIIVTEVLQVTASENTVVFEFRDTGSFNNTPYKNRVAVSFSIRDEMVCGYREYFGSDGKSN